MAKFTPDMSDEELDRLFRDAAGDYHPPFDPQAWEKMEKKLDGDAGGGNGQGKKNISWFLAVLLLIALIAGYRYLHQDRREIKTREHMKQVLGEITAKPVAARNTANKILSRDDNHQSGVVRPAGAQAGDRLARHTTAFGNNAYGKSMTQPGRQGIIRSTDLIQGDTARNHPDAIENKPPDQDRLPYKTEYRLADIEMGRDSSSIFSHPDSTGINHAPVTGMINTADSSGVAGHGQKPTERPAGRWRLGLVAGPDLATVKFRQWTSPGVNAGLMLSYRFTKRLSMESGVLYSSKIYTARPQDYHPKQPIPNYYYLKEIDANCSVIDVPVNLRYDLYLRKQHRLFVSTGLSSFWMKEENYTYKFGWNISSTNREVYNQNQHLFSIWNISMGYERQLGSRFSIQAAPFVKLPLSGIGYGGVKLTSTGVLFALKYGL